MGHLQWTRTMVPIKNTVLHGTYSNISGKIWSHNCQRKNTVMRTHDRYNSYINVNILYINNT